MPYAAPIHRPFAYKSAKDKKRELDSKRGSAASRGYDAAWKKLRDAYIQAHPLCECDECEAGAKQITVAQVVDHIVPISERPDLRLDWNNLRSMSKQHHDRRTARDQGFNKGKKMSRSENRTPG